MGDHQTDSWSAWVENRVPQLTDYVLIDFEDTTAKLIAWLPAGAIILDVLVNVTEAFDDTSTDYLDVGDGTTANKFADDIDLSSIAMKSEALNTTPKVPSIRLTDDTGIYATYVGANGNAAAGSAQVSVLWVPSHQKELDS